MTLLERIANLIIRAITSLICRIDADQLEKVPHQGPLILVTNHINFLEAPIIYTRLTPRRVTAFGKVETWNSLFFSWIFNLWGLIPIKRGEPDRKALRAGLAALKDGQILGIAPEGTRSNDGKLLKGRSGVVMMALLSGAPILPIMHYGSEKYQHNLKRFRRTDVKIIVGRSFTLDPGGKKVTHAVREQMTTDIMVQMAKLLPPDYRGEYSDLSAGTECYLHFE